MEVKFYYPRWGSESVAWGVFAQKVKDNGFNGIEVYPLQAPQDKHEMLLQLAEKGLDLVLLHVEPVEGKDFTKYLQALERNLYALADYQTSAIKPKFITSQTGREYYTKPQMAACFALCDRISAETGIKIIQETHRNKWSFAAHVVHDYLLDFPNLQLALDLSHWVCVSESYLEDQQEAVELAIKHSAHLHARVGHLEGPQVTDPRAPENAEALQHHLSWWDKWFQYHQGQDTEVVTVSPEFGPHPYMMHKPFTQEPIASQWEINCWMKDVLKERFANVSSKVL